jgi:hypothetical protein
LEQWQWQTAEPPVEHWQFGSKWPVGLRHPESDRPLMAASGTIAHITAGLKRPRIERKMLLRAMLDTIGWATPTF